MSHRLLGWLVAAAVVCPCAFGRALVAQNGAASARPAVTTPRLYVLDGGVLESDPGRYRLTKEDVGTTQLSVAAYLIAHPRGVLLWDTGAIADEEWTATGQPVVQRLTLDDGQPRQVTLRTPLRAQLAAAGYGPRDITHLSFSHYHWDHTANAAAFAHATWLVRPVERDAMFSGRALGSVRTKLYAALKDSRTQLIEKDEHDVFGDGTVVLKAAPGHSPGHQVLYVKLARTGGVLLSGDLYHYRQERTMNRYPTFEVDEGQTRASRGAVEAFMTRTGAQLWIQHDLVAHRQLRQAPEFYD